MEIQQLERRFQGCLVGLAVGDALGAPVEGLTRQAIAAQFGSITDMISTGRPGLSPGDYTDDTAMMLCIAESLVEKGEFDPEDVADRFLQWYQTNPILLAGRTTIAALEALESSVPWHRAGEVAHQRLGTSAGNGAIMRCAPIALRYFRNERDLIKASADSALITHWDLQARWAAVALNLIIARLLLGRREGVLDEVIPKIMHPRVAGRLQRALALEMYDLKTSSYVLDTLQVAVWCFFKTFSFEDALVTAVNLGGDTDTQGAVCGAMAGAYYGIDAIPERWLNSLKDRERIASLGLALLRLATAQQRA